MVTVLQIFSFPGQFRYMAQTSPNDASLRWPLTFLVGFVFLCAQVVIISIWKLLVLIQVEEIFSDKSLIWYDRIMQAIAAASFVPAGALILLFIYGDDPGLPMLLITIIMFLAVLFLVTYLLKSRTKKVIELLGLKI